MADEDFAPPAVDPIPGGVDDDDDIGEVRVPVILPLAAFLAILSALFTASAGAQGIVLSQEKGIVVGQVTGVKTS